MNDENVIKMVEIIEKASPGINKEALYEDMIRTLSDAKRQMEDRKYATERVNALRRKVEQGKIEEVADEHAHELAMYNLMQAAHGVCSSQAELDYFLKFSYASWYIEYFSNTEGYSYGKGYDEFKKILLEKLANIFKNYGLDLAPFQLDKADPQEYCYDILKARIDEIINLSNQEQAPTMKM